MITTYPQRYKQLWIVKNGDFRWGCSAAVEGVEKRFHASRGPVDLQGIFRNREFFQVPNGALIADSCLTKNSQHG
jgi:hypothetical protein